MKIVDYDGDVDSLSANLGTTFNFTCPSNLSLIGPSSTTCTESGEWEPDPSRVMCTKGNELAWLLLRQLVMSSGVMCTKGNELAWLLLCQLENAMIEII